MQGDLIVDRILTDARLQADDIVQQAKKEEARMQQDELLWQKQKSNETSKRLKEKEREIAAATEVSAKIECKKVELQTKANLLEAIKQNAINELCNLGKTQAKKLFESLLRANAHEHDTLLWKCKNLSEKDVLSLPVVKKLSLEVRPGEKDGIFLCGKNCDANLLYETLVEGYVSENLKEISELLF